MIRLLLVLCLLSIAAWSLPSLRPVWIAGHGNGNGNGNIGNGNGNGNSGNNNGNFNRGNDNGNRNPDDGNGNGRTGNGNGNDGDRALKAREIRFAGATLVASISRPSAASALEPARKTEA